jgi:hypothetical protein
MRPVDMSNGALEQEERRLSAARDGALQQRRPRLVGKLTAKLSAVRREITKRKHLAWAANYSPLTTSEYDPKPGAGR